MELNVQNIGKIKEANIEIKGVTVITGYNSTGKSSVCKALYGIMDSYSDMDRKVALQRRNSVRNAIFGWKNQIESIRDIYAKEFNDFIKSILEIALIPKTNENDILLDSLFDLCRKNNVDIPLEDLRQLSDKLTEIIKRDKDDYIRFIVLQNLKNIFSNQMGHVNLNGCSSILLADNNRFCRVVFQDDKLIGNEYKNASFKKPVYIEPESVLDNCENMQQRLFMWPTDRKEEPIQSFLLEDEITEDKLTLEQYQEREKNIKLIKEILDSVTKGHLIKNKETGFSYAEKGLQQDIVCKNIASGLKPFLMIQRMVENGSLEAGRLLIIDEPEVNLHPAWQLKFAKVLVLLNTELRLQVVISTHSPYFLRAVDYYMEEQGNSENGRYYLTKEISDDLYTLIDVTNDKEQIYKTMYEPLEEID